MLSSSSSSSSSTTTTSIVYDVATSDDDLKEILELQEANCITRLNNNSSTTTAAAKPTSGRNPGFVTARHTLPLLRAMSANYPHVVARCVVTTKEDTTTTPTTTSTTSNKIVGYALSLTSDFDATLIPSLEDLNAVINQSTFRGRPIPSYRYFIMGQVCIHKDFRGDSTEHKGIFAGLYHEMKQRLAPPQDSGGGGHGFDLLVTAISHNNPRSMRAHTKIGFQNVYDYASSDGGHWSIVVWDWK